MTIEKTLRRAASKSGLSMKAISDRAGVHYFTVWGFLTKPETTITVRTADMLCELFGLELKPVKAKRRKGR